MTISTAQTVTLEIVSLIAAGQYADALQACSNSRLSEAGIEGVIRSCGRTFIRPPADSSEYLDVIKIEGRSVPTWSVRAPLWTVEEGRSDLTFELTIADEVGGAEIELDDLRIL